LRLVVVSPFVDRRHGTERALAELLERLARDYDCEIHLYAQRVDDLSLSNPRPAQTSGFGAILWHKVPTIPGPHLVQFLGWMFLNGFLRRWHAMFGGPAYDLLLSPGINCLHPDVVAVHALFHQLRKLTQEENKEEKAGAGFFRRLHRRIYYGLLAALEGHVYSDSRISLAAVSPRMAGLLKDYFAREDVCVIANGVDASHFSVVARLARRTAAREARGFREEDFVLLLIGNDWRVKGLPAILDAMAQLPALPLRLLAAGSDSVEAFREKAKQLGVLDRCRWEPPRPDVLDFYAAADVYVSPSLEESFGLPVAEAMSCGLPAITSVHAGVADFVHNGVDGFVMSEPRDARYLAQLIQRLQSDEVLSRKIGEAASQKALDWTWNRHAAEVWQLLKKAAAQKSASYDS
jgi:glycosyltransferase involved in cell wall biosynthesis